MRPVRSLGAAVLLFARTVQAVLLDGVSPRAALAQAHAIGSRSTPLVVGGMAAFGVVMVTLAQTQARIDELKAEFPSSPYVDQANLSAARLLVENGELQPAADRLRTVMDSTKDRELALVARLRLARVQIALGKADDALTTLANTDAGAFEPRFQEVRGDAYLAKGDKESALREYRAARTVTGRQVVDTTVLDLKINDLLPASAAEKNPPSTASAGS